MKKFLSIATRTVIGFFAAIIAAGAFLEGGYFTWIGGVVLALFATVNPENISKRTNVSYVLAFVAFSLLFLALSFIDMNRGVGASV